MASGSRTIATLVVVVAVVGSEWQNELLLSAFCCAVET